MLNQTAEYALRTAVHLAEHGTDRAIPASDLAFALSIPSNYLSKILHQLARDGLLTSQRGKSGGFRLARPVSEITLIDIVGPFDAVETKRGCLMGRPTCSDATPCQAHEGWKALGASLADFFRNTTLDTLITPPKRVRSPSAGTRGRPAKRGARSTPRGRTR